MRYLLLINLFLLSITNVFAVSKQVTTLEQEEEILDLMETPTRKKTSAEVRKSQNVAVMFGHGFEYTDFTTSIKVGLIQDNRILTLKTAFSSHIIGGNSSFGIDETAAVSVGAKFFVGNSFYLGTKIYYRHYSMDRSNEVDSWFNGTKKYTYDDIGAGFLLGNQWSFNKFTIGCDWFGINNTLITVKEEGRSDIFGTNDPGVSISFLNFYIGMVF